MNLDYDKTCEECLKEMFKRVGEEYPNELTNQEDWYMKRSWTIEEQNDFKDWMIKHLKKRHPSWNKRTIDMEVGTFILQWAWTNEKK